MAVTGLPATRCPKCDSPYTVDLETSLRFCPECRHEWDPTQPQTAADVLGPPAGVDPEPAVDVPDELSDQLLADAYLETLIGSTVILEGGQPAMLLEFVDDDQVRVQLRDGRVEQVALGDIERSVPDAPPATIEEVDLDDETAQLVGDAVLTMACLAVEAGLGAIVGTGDDAHLIEPPAGWIPSDIDAIPLIEQAAAVAVALLAISFDLPREMITEAIRNIRPSTREVDNKGDQQ